MLFYIKYFQTSASNSLAITEEYISTFKPSGYARTFGRALNNQQCGGAHLHAPGTVYYVPPKHPFFCPFSKADVADLTLHVTMSGSTTTATEKEIKQLGIYENAKNVIDSIDAYLFIPLTGVETGNIGSVVFKNNPYLPLNKSQI